jgi:hypothetical protein
MARFIRLDTIQVEGNPEINCIEVDLQYEDGGYNHWHSTRICRGYYVDIAAVHVMVRGGIASKTLMSDGSGYRLLLEEASRFGQKKLESLQQKAREKAAAVIDRLCSEKGLVRTN